MNRKIVAPLILNLALAAGLVLAGGREARAEDPERGRCCRFSVEGPRYCCTTCCTSINQCAATTDCRQESWLE